ncbi:MAG: hypothetical protein Aurels2KO_21650 [Aureliella sp.]
MDERISQEFALLREAYPAAVYHQRWVLLHGYELPAGWSVASIDVAFFLKAPYPANSPYGIYTPPGLTFEGKPPANYAAAKHAPPFPGTWAMFSWQAEQWAPGKTAASGHNMLTWSNGIGRRFMEGV